MTGHQAHRHVVVMGVSGTGKSTIAAALADELGLVMAEGDDHHPPANVAKMRAGVPLDDADRVAWLESLARWTTTQHEQGRDTVVSCSALKRRYRDVLRGAAPEPTVFVHLAGARDVLAARMAGRTHFMPVSLLESQLATLEELDADEVGGTVDVGQPLEQVLYDALGLVRRLTADWGRRPRPPAEGAD